jgi:hypothetical protein
VGLIDIQALIEPLIRSTVPLAHLQLAAGNLFVMPAGAIDSVVINVLSDVSHRLEHRKRSIVSREGAVNLDLRSRHSSCQLGGPAQSPQGNYKKLKIGPIAEEESLVFWLGGTDTTVLQGDGVHSLIHKAEGTL